MSDGRPSTALPLLLVLVVCDGRRGTADRWSGRGPQTKKKAADPGFGFRGLEEDQLSG
jgi:hypothetical protein